MKSQRIFISTFIIGLGLYFLLQDYSISFLEKFDTWPTILMIIGIAFLLQSFLGNSKENIFPGIILLGIGIHLHGLFYYSFWINHWSVYLLIMGLAFLAKQPRSKSSYRLGLLLLVISIISILLYLKPNWFAFINFSFLDGISLLPLFLIGIGLFVLFSKN